MRQIAMFCVAMCALFALTGFSSCSDDDPVVETVVTPPTPEEGENGGADASDGDSSDADAPSDSQPDADDPAQDDSGEGNATADDDTTATAPDDNSSDQTTDNSDQDDTMEGKIRITVGETSFTATLADTEAARAFAAMLPLTLPMEELNGNEKYHYLDRSLPTDSRRPGTIEAGDIMLYGSSCVVLFYESFATSYSYTPIGRIDNPSELASALGSGDVTVTFE